MKRRDVKGKHEESFIDSYINFLNQNDDLVKSPKIVIL